MAYGCITHHYACNCREAEFAAIKAERDALRQRIESAPVGEVILDERGCPTISCDFEEGKRVRLVVDKG